MKYTAFTFLSLATTVASCSSGEFRQEDFLCSKDYLGVCAVHDDTSMAICGNDLQGCFTYDHQRWLTDRVRFGDYTQIGSNKQIWTYDKGMLKNRHSGSCIGIVRRDFAPKGENDYFESSPLFSPTLTHAVRMYECDPENMGQRWIIGEDDQRLHAFANDALCLTMRSDNEDTPQEDKAAIDLSRCTSNEEELAHRQRLQLIGDPGAIQSFVHSSQADYGFEDTIRLAFWLHSKDEEAMEPANGSKHKLQVFVADAEGDQKPVYTQSCKDDRVTVFSAARLLSSVPDIERPTRFVARFGQVESEPFTVHPDEMHIEAKAGNCDNDEKVEIGLVVAGAIALLAIGAFVVRSCCGCCCGPSNRAASHVEESANKVIAADDDDDAMTQGSDEEIP
jgi:hypothetical protein